MSLRQVPQVWHGPQVGVDARREEDPFPELQQEEERPRKVEKQFGREQQRHAHRQESQKSVERRFWRDRLL